MTDLHKSVSHRLRTLLLLMLQDESDDFTARRLSNETDIPLGTISSIVSRGGDYGWITSRLEGGCRLYSVNTNAIPEIRDALNAPALPDLPHRHTEAAGARPATRHRGPAVTSDIPDYGPVRTLSQLVAEEPRPIVEGVCRQLGWPSPYEDPKPARRRAPRTGT